MQYNQIIQYNVLHTPWPLEDNSIDCCITSPPYWRVRDYKVEGQLGLEKTPEEYVQKIVNVFDEVKRVLKPKGTLWLNLGDTFAKNGDKGMKPKDLVLIPFMVAIALRNAGWYLRQDIIWHKPNAMPESCQDRCTKAHEYIFLLSKSSRYYYDADAIREPRTDDENAATFRGGAYVNNELSNSKMGKRTVKGNRKIKVPGGWDTKPGAHGTIHREGRSQAEYIQSTEEKEGRNKRSVWTVATSPFPYAHYATFPESLIRPCILAGCPKNGIVLDPFMGAGTTALVAKSYDRQYLGLELDAASIRIAHQRLKQKFGIFYNY